MKLLVHNKKFYLLVIVLLFIVLIALFLLLRNHEREKERESQVEVQPVATTSDTQRFNLPKHDNWDYEPNDMSSPNNFEDSCESLTDKTKKFWIGFCGTFVTSLDKVVFGAMENITNPIRTDMTIDGHKAVMIEGIANGAPEIHIYIDHVLLQEYPGGEDEEELLDYGQRPVPKYGTLDTMFIPLFEPYTQEEFNQAKNEYIKIVSAMDFKESAQEKETEKK